MIRNNFYCSVRSAIVYTVLLFQFNKCWMNCVSLTVCSFLINIYIYLNIHFNISTHSYYHFNMLFKYSFLYNYVLFYDLCVYFKETLSKMKDHRVTSCWNYSLHPSTQEVSHEAQQSNRGKPLLLKNVNQNRY